MNTAKRLPDQDDTSHFSNRVPKGLRLKLLELSEAVKSDFISEFRESYACARIDAIYGYHISGFIPSQLGGYEVSEFYRSDTDTSYHFTRAQSEAMDKQQAHCYECFARDYKEELQAYFKGIGKEMPEAGDLSHSDIEAAGLDNDFAEYENEFFEPALLRCEIWIDDPERKGSFVQDRKEPESVFIRMSLNYRDQPYYRGKHDDTLFEYNTPSSEVLELKAEDFVKQLRAKMNGVK